MRIFWEKIENGKYRIYKLKSPLLWYGLWISSYLLIIVGIITKLKFLGVIGFFLLFFLALIACFEGGFPKDDARIAKIRGKKVILKGKVFSTKEPLERWIEK